MRRLLASTLFLVALATPLHAQEDASMTARGTFDPTVTPASDDGAPGPIDRYALEKQFRGDLEGESSGVMLGSGSPDEGAAGYVALEHVTGTLNGRSGGFVLQHLGSMSDGGMELRVQVVPGSGTGDLTGLAGEMTIVIEDGEHSYEFEYTLEESAADGG
ncbi:MAG: DUF3224 domain-containing protein [Gemmatimonadota bacterium]